MQEPLVWVLLPVAMLNIIIFLARPFAGKLPRKFREFLGVVSAETQVTQQLARLCIAMAVCETRIERGRHCMTHTLNVCMVAHLCTRWFHGNEWVNSGRKGLLLVKELRPVWKVVETFVRREFANGVAYTLCIDHQR
jgi:hypothetical protein